MAVLEQHYETVDLLLYRRWNYLDYHLISYFLCQEMELKIQNLYQNIKYSGSSTPLFFVFLIGNIEIPFKLGVILKDNM
jgi:hypothetical protein